MEIKKGQTWRLRIRLKIGMDENGKAVVGSKKHLKLPGEIGRMGRCEVAPFLFSG